MPKQNQAAEAKPDRKSQSQVALVVVAETYYESAWANWMYVYSHFGSSGTGGIVPEEITPRSSWVSRTIGCQGKGDRVTGHG